jgi:hypothetical protein
MISQPRRLGRGRREGEIAEFALSIVDFACSWLDSFDFRCRIRPESSFSTEFSNFECTSA